MNITEARSSVGQMIYSFDAGEKLIPRVSTAHGPYKLLRITKAGLAILEGREEYRVSPSLLFPAQISGLDVSADRIELHVYSFRRR